mgnify:CR=1 FL=1
MAQKGTSWRLAGDVQVAHFLLGEPYRCYLEGIEQLNEAALLLLAQNAGHAQLIVDLYLNALNLPRQRQSATGVQGQMGCNENKTHFMA